MSLSLRGSDARMLVAVPASHCCRSPAGPASEQGYFDPVLSAPDPCARPAANAGSDRPFWEVGGGHRNASLCAAARGERGTDMSEARSTTISARSASWSRPFPTGQRYFDQGLRLAFGFNHAEARRAFRAAQQHDPDCAMCFWGEAFVLGPNINAPMDAEAVEPAMAACAGPGEGARCQRARAGMIAASGDRYSDDPKAERAALDRDFAAAMRRSRRGSPRTTSSRCCMPRR